MLQITQSNFRHIRNLVILAALIVLGFLTPDIVSAAPPPIPIKTLTTVDSSGSIGEYTSLALNSSGFPVISYYDATNGDLKVAICYDKTCSNPTLTIVDSIGLVGEFSSLALNSNDFPVISYWDRTNNDLKLAVCNNVTCTNPTLTTVDSTGFVGFNSSLRLNGSGLPVISYPDGTNGDLKVAVCHNVTCTARTLTTVDSTVNVGANSSLRLNGSGLPVISYLDSTNFDLKVAVCHNVTCTVRTLTIIDSTGDVGFNTSLALNKNGFPVISYYDQTNVDLKVAVCNDVACTVRTLTTVDSLGDVAWTGTSLALNGSGFPVISYYDGTNDDTKVATCTDETCTNPILTTVDNVGTTSSMVLNSSGVPVISYGDYTIGNLKMAVCTICAISLQRITVDNGDGNSVGQYSSLALRNNDMPSISYYDDTEADLLLAVCNDTNCSSVTKQDVRITGDAGKYNSLALNSSELPVISYFDDTDDDLMVAVCRDLSCTSRNINVVSGLLGLAVGRYSSLALKSNDLPIISFYDDTNTSLNLALCGDTDCNPTVPIAYIDNFANVGRFNSLALTNSELSVMSYYYSNGLASALKLAICNDATCTNPTIRTIDTTFIAGRYTSLALNNNDFAVISSGGNGVLKLAVCPNATCTTPTLTTVDATADVGTYTSVALNSSNFPIISYYDSTNNALKIAFCTDIACTNPALMTVDGAANNLAVGEYTSLALDNSGYPVVSYRDQTNTSLKTVFFDYLPAPNDAAIHRLGSSSSELAWSGGSLYDVWQSTTPYFNPCFDAATKIGDDVRSPMDVSAFIGAPNSNHTFIVTARHDPCDGSNLVGEFDFALIPGN